MFLNFDRYVFLSGRAAFDATPDPTTAETGITSRVTIDPASPLAATLGVGAGALPSDAELQAIATAFGFDAKEYRHLPAGGRGHHERRQN